LIDLVVFQYLYLVPIPQKEMGGFHPSTPASLFVARRASHLSIATRNHQHGFERRNADSLIHTVNQNRDTISPISKDTCTLAGLGALTTTAATDIAIQRLVCGDANGNAAVNFAGTRVDAFTADKESVLALGVIASLNCTLQRGIASNAGIVEIIVAIRTEMPVVVVVIVIVAATIYSTLSVTRSLDRGIKKGN
jgi:hypothetical protein